MKNRIKKILGFACVAVMSVALLAGCGKEKPKETEAETVPETEEDEILDLEASVGVVVSLKSNELTMETADGKELVFDITEAGKKGEKDIKEDNAVVVVYTGRVSGTNTDSAVVQLVIGIDAETGSANGTDAEDGAEGDLKGQMTGEVTKYIEGEKLVIENASDGELYYFATASAEISGSEDIEEGDTVQVSYVGDINGNDLVDATKITVKTTGSSSSNGSVNTSGAKDTITGEVVSASMNTVTIETADGTTYTFSTMDAEVDVTGGLSVGQEIELTYRGDLEDGAENVDVTLVEEAE